jgi:hypothetical protein
LGHSLGHVLSESVSQWPSLVVGHHGQTQWVSESVSQWVGELVSQWVSELSEYVSRRLGRKLFRRNQTSTNMLFVYAKQHYWWQQRARCGHQHDARRVSQVCLETRKKRTTPREIWAARQVGKGESVFNSPRCKVVWRHWSQNMLHDQFV